MTHFPNLREFYCPEKDTRSERCLCRNSFIFTTKQNTVVLQQFQGELKCILLKTRLCFSRPGLRGGEEPSRWCHRHSPSITLIINLNAVEGADNKELKGNRLAESEEKKEEEQEGQCMNYTFTPQSEVPALFMSNKKKKPTQLSQNCSLSAVECNSSSLNT